MKELSEAAKSASSRIAKAIATTLLSEARQQALRQIFSIDQLKRIDAECMRRGVDRHLFIAEIIEAGMGSKGIGPKGAEHQMKSLGQEAAAAYRSLFRVSPSD